VVASEVMPVAGADYPATFQQLRSWFPDDDACVEYLARLRWPDGFRCPVCASADAWRTGSGLWLCQSCRRKTSVTAGTIFHRSRLPLTDWFAAAWFVTSQKNGVSALGLQRVLGLGSYQTAWTWLHKFRRAMVRPERDQLTGLVEVDETLLGAREHRGRNVGHSTINKAVVVIAVELLEEPQRLGRIRLAHMRTVSAESLCGFVGQVVMPGATVRTDGWNVYHRLARQGYRHDVVNVARVGPDRVRGGADLTTGSAQIRARRPGHPGGRAGIAAGSAGRATVEGRRRDGREPVRARRTLPRQQT
jgi:transposase-like protein